MKGVGTAAVFGALQAYFVVQTEGHEFLQLPSLFPNGLALIASVAGVMALAYAAASTTRAWLTALLFWVLFGFGFFEMGYFCSRVPPISDVSLCHSLRPWPRNLPLAGVAATVTLLLSLSGAEISADRARRPVESRP
jgi:hypothetical protein